MSGAAPHTLSSLHVGASGVVTALSGAREEADWLRAVGLVEGVTVTLLRSAPWGGPLHVRLSTGLELALDRDLATHVSVGA